VFGFCGYRHHCHLGQRGRVTTARQHPAQQRRTHNSSPGAPTLSPLVLLRISLSTGNALRNECMPQYNEQQRVVWGMQARAPHPGRLSRYASSSGRRIPSAPSLMSRGECLKPSLDAKGDIAPPPTCLPRHQRVTVGNSGCCHPICRILRPYCCSRFQDIP
jgi:hypothetical protein